MHPVGPQKPKVYWVRRILLLGAVTSTFILLYSLLTKPAESPVANSVPLPAPSQSILASSPTTSSISSSPVPSESTQLTPTPTPSEISICSDDQISVAVTIAPQTPKVNESMKLSMTITNTSLNACQRDVGSGANEITIISGPALIWSTDHCNPSTATDLRVLEPNQKMSVTATWSGMQTSKGCVEHNQATAGTYWAHARNASKNSDGVRFVITD